MISSILLLILLACLLYGSVRIQPGSHAADALFPWRGLLAFVIITDHLSQELASPGLMLPFSYMGYIAVSLFFGLSGYGLSAQLQQKGDSYLNRFWTLRLPKILIPFWLCNLVYILADVLFYHQIPSLFSGVLYFFGIRLINSNTWYVVSLLVLYAAFWISAKGFRDRPLFLLGSVFVLSCIYGLFCLLVVRKYWWMNSIYAFTVGIALHRFPDLKTVLFRNRASVWLLSAAWCVVFLAGWILPTIPLGLICMIGASIGIFVLFFLLTEHVALDGRFLRFLADISFEFYMVHNCFRHLYKDVFPIPGDGLYYLAAFGSSLLFAWLIHAAVQKLPVPYSRRK